MDNNNTNEEYFKSIKNGIALAMSFIIVAIFLYANPLYFFYSIVSKILSVLFLLIGIIGLGTELNKLNGENKKIGFDDLGVGLSLIILWAIMHYYCNNIFINILLIVILLFSSYGIVLGIINISHNLIKGENSFSKKILKLCIAIAQVTAFVGALLQIMQILKILK